MERPLDPIPALLEPKAPENLERIEYNLTEVFPDSKISKWMLAMLCARNDLSVAIKLLVPYLASSDSINELHKQFRSGIMVYFWRLYLSHLHEAWTLFHKIETMNDSVAVRIKSSEKIKTLKSQIRDFRGQKNTQGVSAGDIIKICRNSLFHYPLIEKNGLWESHVRELSGKGQTVACIRSKSGFVADDRWSIADEYTVAVLNQSGFFEDLEFQKKYFVPMVGILRELIDACIEEYLNSPPESATTKK